MRNEFPYWVSATFIFSLALCGFLLTPPDLIGGAIILLLFPVLGASMFVSIAPSGNPQLILTGAGFVESTYYPNRIDYAQVASMVLVPQREALKIVYATGDRTEWTPIRKYGFYLEDIIQDYRRYKAERAASK